MVNVGKAQALHVQGRMQPAEPAAFEMREEFRSGIGSREQPEVDLPETYLGLLRANAAAWEFFQERSATDRKAASWWIASALQAKTRLA